MSRILLALTGITLCATLPSVAADPAQLQTHREEELRAAVTDMPEIVDMSYADPKTWHSLPPAALVHDNERTLGSAVELHALRTFSSERSDRQSVRFEFINRPTSFSVLRLAALLLLKSAEDVPRK